MSLQSGGINLAQLLVFKDILDVVADASKKSKVLAEIAVDLKAAQDAQLVAAAEHAEAVSIADKAQKDTAAAQAVAKEAAAKLAEAVDLLDARTVEASQLRQAKAEFVKEKAAWDKLSQEQSEDLAKLSAKLVREESRLANSQTAADEVLAEYSAKLAKLKELAGT